MGIHVAQSSQNAEPGAQPSPCSLQALSLGLGVRSLAVQVDSQALCWGDCPPQGR